MPGNLQAVLVRALVASECIGNVSGAYQLSGKGGAADFTIGTSHG